MTADATTPLPDLSTEELDALLQQPDGPPLLLDLWAPWCQPCLQQAPALQRLAAEAGERLAVVKLNIDQHPAVAQRLGVRGIPTLVLFRQGQEQARLNGLQTREQLRQWLDGQDVDLGLAAADTGREREPAPLGGAFYGDESLRRFLVERLLDHARAQEIPSTRFPFWAENTGTVGCAMVRHEDAEVFARVTGLPAALGGCLHFVNARTAPVLDGLFQAMPAGADLRRVPALLMWRWLSDDGSRWPALLGPQADALRLDWLRLTGAQLGVNDGDGEESHPPLPADWAALREQALALVKPGAAHSTDRHLALMLQRLIPLPGAEATPAWMTALLMYGTFFVHTKLRVDLGWTPQDLAVEEIRYQWYETHCENPQSRTKEEMDQFHARFQAEHAAMLADYDPKEQAYFDQYETLSAPEYARLQALLADVLKAEASA